jgi:hypothetical protein
MRGTTLDYRPDQATEDRTDTSRVSVTTSLMTPARRAALDALEREFGDLLRNSSVDIKQVA